MVRLGWTGPLESSLDFATLRAFMASHIETYEQLEALLLLHRRGQGLTPAVVASELKIEAHEASQALRRLVGANLVAIDDSADGKLFRYSPGSTELGGAVQLLAEAYDESRVKLVQLMNANAFDRARMIALRAFADGFRLSGSKKDG